MYSIANNAGRLVELTMATPISLDEANRAFLEIRRCLDAVGRKVIVVADLTKADIFAPDVSDKFTLLMRAHNPVVERSGFWVADAPTFGLQFMRMIREAGHPARRLFKVRTELESWLAQLLTVPERDRMRVYLDERERSKFL